MTLRSLVWKMEVLLGDWHKAQVGPGKVEFGLDMERLWYRRTFRMKHT